MHREVRSTEHTTGGCSGCYYYSGSVTSEMAQEEQEPPDDTSESEDREDSTNEDLHDLNSWSTIPQVFFKRCKQCYTFQKIL